MSTATTRKRYVLHNQKCYACGKPQGTSFLGYDPHTLKSYCLRNCRNSKGIPKDVELIPMDNDSLLAAIEEHYSGFNREMINSLIGKTASVRLQPAHIMHLMKVAELEGFDKIQATLVNIIENDMKERNLDHVQLAEQEDYEEPEEIEEDPIQAKINNKPVKVERKVEKEPEVEEDGEEEDDFSF